MTTKVLFSTAAILAVAGSALATGDRIVLASGSLVRGNNVFPNAVVTYNPVLDASGVGSNPGIELWPSAEAEAAGTGRLSRSNDNNGQWNYAPAGAFFSNGSVFVYGTKTGSHGPRGNVWSGGQGMFLAQSAASYSDQPDILEDGRKLFGPFTLRRGNTLYTEAYVTYDPVLDASGLGSNPGINVWPSLAAAEARVNSLSRANDNNGQWNYEVNSVFNFGEQLYILGGRGAGSGTKAPRVWTTFGAGSFLLQTLGLSL